MKYFSVLNEVMPHITQIAAVEIKSAVKFNVYVKRQVLLTADAQRLTGISLLDSDTMTVNGQAVEAATITTALEKRDLEIFQCLFGGTQRSSV